MPVLRPLLLAALALPVLLHAAPPKKPAQNPLSGAGPAARTAPRSAHQLAPEALELATSLGYLRGIVSLELIRPDLIALTVDGGIVPGGALLGGGPELGLMPEDLQTPAAFQIDSATDPRYAEGVEPLSVNRASYEYFNAKDVATSWPIGAAGPLLRHRYYLRLPQALADGKRYQIKITGADAESRYSRETTLDYSSRTTSTPVIKINQLAYSAVTKERYAYLGWWAGDGGKVDYSDLSRFEVLAPDGRVALTGSIALRRPDHALSGEDVYQLDISALKPGAYRIHIPGFASSDTFHVGGTESFERFYHTQRAFFHQRCGQELREPWTAFTRPACHTEFYESGQAAGDFTAEMHNFGRPPSTKSYEPKAGEARMSFSGGYHDAADFDTFTSHLISTCQNLVVYEAFPKVFTDSQLNLPESGNGIPDVLDEAVWAIKFYLENQYPNGGVPLGRVNLCDARHQFFAGGKDKAPLPPFGMIPPTEDSTPMFAAAAAQLSRLLRPYDAPLAERLLAAARRAFDYADKRGMFGILEDFRNERTPIQLRKDNQGRYRSAELFDSRLIQAAGELLHTTGEARYNDYIATHTDKSATWDNFALHHHPYLAAPANVTTPAVRERLLDRLLRTPNLGAESLVASAELGGYRMSNGDKPSVGWGAAQGVNHNPTLIAAYLATREARYLEAAARNADWHSGANPASMTFLTSMGYRHPNRPEISWFLYKDRSDRELFGNTVMGIAIYGFGPALRTHPGNGRDSEVPGWPLWRSWRDVWGNHAEIYSEFTVTQTVGPAAMTYAFLYALDREAGAVSPDAKPRYPLGLRN